MKLNPSTDYDTLVFFPFILCLVGFKHTYLPKNNFLGCLEVVFLWGCDWDCCDCDSGKTKSTHCILTKTWLEFDNDISA